ncbi:MAG: hypothetical protein VYA37_03865 [Actinomycetota bacterium]|nr:hypothetical protein [Actinomycetota bacterium]
MVKKINLSKVGSFISIIKTAQTWNIDDLLKLEINTYDLKGLLKFLLLTNPTKITLKKIHKTLLLEALNG